MEIKWQLANPGPHEKGSLNRCILCALVLTGPSGARSSSEIRWLGQSDCPTVQWQQVHRDWVDHRTDSNQVQIFVSLQSLGFTGIANSCIHLILPVNSVSVWVRTCFGFMLSTDCTVALCWRYTLHWVLSYLNSWPMFFIDVGGLFPFTVVYSQMDGI